MASHYKKKTKTYATGVLPMLQVSVGITQKYFYLQMFSVCKIERLVPIISIWCN